MSVELPKELGKGVKLDDALNTSQVKSLVEHINQNSQLRTIAGSFDVVEGGHLVCEVRQWTLQGFAQQQAWSWMRQLSTASVGPEDRQEWNQLVEQLLQLSG